MSFAVAITGVGVASPFGMSAGALWSAVLAGTDGRRPWSRTTSAAYPFSSVIEMADARPGDPKPGDDTAAGRARAMARHAVAQARREAGIDGDAGRIGCMLGSTTMGIEELEHGLHRGTGTLPGRSVLQGHAQDWSGPAGVVSTACSSGLLAPALAMDVLACDEADAMLAGGVDVLLEYTLGGFNGLRLLGEGRCRPFAAGRQSVVLSEGAVVFCLEPLARARARNARVLGVIMGSAFACDAGHMTAPDAAGLARTMALALQDAGASPTQVSCIFAHGTGTVANDAAEAAALVRVFAPGPVPPVAAVKSTLGHSQAAAGAFGLLCALQSLEQDVLPPTAGVGEVDPELAAIKLACDGSKMPAGSLAMVNAFGFGGNNCVLMLARGDRS